MENSFWWEIFGGKFLREIAKKNSFSPPKNNVLDIFLTEGLVSEKGVGMKQVV